MSIMLEGQIKQLEKRQVRREIKRTNIVWCPWPYPQFVTESVYLDDYVFILAYKQNNQNIEQNVKYTGELHGMLIVKSHVKVWGQMQAGVLIASAIFDVDRNAWVVGGR
jgi:hypothetical protein